MRKLIMTSILLNLPQSETPFRFHLFPPIFRIQILLQFVVLERHRQLQIMKSHSVQLLVNQLIRKPLIIQVQMWKDPLFPANPLHVCADLLKNSDLTTDTLIANNILAPSRIVIIVQFVLFERCVQLLFVDASDLMVDNAHVDVPVPRHSFFKF